MWEYLNLIDGNQALMMRWDLELREINEEMPRLLLKERNVSNESSNMIPPGYRTWTKCSEDAHDMLWTCYVRSIYIPYPVE